MALVDPPMATLDRDEPVLWTAPGIAKRDPVRDPSQEDLLVRIVEKLKDPEAGVRFAAVVSLGALAPQALAEHVKAVVSAMGDGNLDVRLAAVETMSNLQPEVLANHKKALVAKLDDPSTQVRYKAVLTLSKLEPEELDTLRLTRAQATTVKQAPFHGDATEAARRAADTILSHLPPL